jgi:hypothetical protein
MRENRMAVVAVALFFGGCSMNNGPVAQDPQVWGRIDCQRGEGNPALQKEFDDAKTTCLLRGESEDAVAGNAGNNPCMSEQGYVLRTRAGHAAACQATGERRGTPAASAKKPISNSRAIAKPATAPEPIPSVAAER